VGNKWQAVPASERLRLGQHDAQVWLALNNLLVDPTARAKYDLDDFRWGVCEPAGPAGPAGLLAC
jgi:hypothetical protein